MHGIVESGLGVFDPGAAGAARRAREIRRARRHSRLVRILKAALPASAVLLLLTLLVPTSVLPRLAGADVALDAVRLSSDGISMDNPRVSGSNAKGQPFDIQARRAVQSITNPKLVTFEDLKAKVRVNERDSATITARSGSFDAERETLKLAGEIRVRSDMGYEADLRSADIDMKRGHLRSDEPAVVRASTGVIEGGTLTIQDHGDRVLFEGGVRMTLHPSQETRR